MRTTARVDAAELCFFRPIVTYGDVRTAGRSDWRTVAIHLALISTAVLIAQTAPARAPRFMKSALTYKEQTYEEHNIRRTDRHDRQRGSRALQPIMEVYIQNMDEKLGTTPISDEYFLGQFRWSETMGPQLLPLAPERGNLSHSAGFLKMFTTQYLPDGT